MQRATGYNASMPIVLNLTSATPCWFNLRPGTLPGHGANSPAFNIIGQERGEGSKVFGPSSETSESSPSTSSTSSIATTNTATGGGTTTPPTSIENDPESQAGASTSSGAGTSPGTTGSTGLSAGAAAGIGVGVAVGVLAAAGGVFAWWWKRSRRGGPNNQPYNPQDTGYRGARGRFEAGGRYDGAHNQAQVYYEKRPRVELSSVLGVSEISSSEGRHNRHELPA